MAPKLAGHLRQLVGYSLVFLGLAVAAACFLTADRHPAVPLWVFVSAAVVLGAPLMIAGGRINSRGRGLVLGMSPEEAATEYHRQNVLLAFYIAFILLLGSLVTVPLVIRATGLADPSDTFFTAWLIAWVLVFCGARQWVTRPLWHAIERRVVGRWEGVPARDGRG